MIITNNLLSGLIILADVDKHPAATNALREATNYLHYRNIFAYTFNYIQWFFVKIAYGIANWSSSFMHSMLKTGSFVDEISGKGTIGQMIRLSRGVAVALMIAALIWVGIKIMVDHEPPKIKSVLVQVVISSFLIFNLGSMTTWIKDQSVEIANGFFDGGSKQNKDNTSSLPFQILSATTNDNEYLINNNFKGTDVKVTPKISNDFKPAKQTFGHNNLTKSQVDAGTVDFYKIIDWNDVDDNKPLSDKDADWKKGDYDHNGTHFLYGWLKYHPESVPQAKTNAVKWVSPDIPRFGGTGDSSSFAWGGYPRYEVDWIPCLISLIVMTIAYIFAGYVIVKSFIELVLMNILGLFLIGSDLSTGQKTKQVVSEVFSSSILISLQAFELAFYAAICQWAVNGLKGNSWGFAIFMLAASTMVITGSQKVSKFFGVDTGAQHGMRAFGSTIYGAKQVVGGVGAAVGAATMPMKAASNLKKRSNDLGSRMNTKGSIQRDANKQARDAKHQADVDNFKKDNNLSVEDFNHSRNPNNSDRKTTAGIKQSDIRQRQQDRATRSEPEAGFNSNNSSGFAPNDIKQQQSDTGQDSSTGQNEKTTVPNKTASSEINKNGTNLDNNSPKGNSDNTGIERYHSWQNRAKQYDKQNNLGRSDSAISYNPKTQQPYSYDDWNNDVDSVRSSDIPDTNLDGSASNLTEQDFNNSTRNEDRTVDDFEREMKTATPEKKKVSKVSNGSKSVLNNTQPAKNILDKTKPNNDTGGSRTDRTYK